MSPPVSSRAFDKCVDPGLRTFHKDTLSVSRRPLGTNTEESHQHVKCGLNVTH